MLNKIESTLLKTKKNCNTNVFSMLIIYKENNIKANKLIWKYQKCIYYWKL